jgi:hypothetical protein
MEPGELPLEKESEQQEPITIDEEEKKRLEAYR